MATTVRDIMTAHCHCIKETDSIQKAAELMAEHHVGALPICGEDDKLHGMITDRDIVVSVIANSKNPSECCASDLATDNVVWVSADSPLADACQKMKENAIKRLPVIDENMRLCGMVSQGDLSQALSNEDAGALVEVVSSSPDNSGSEQ